MKLDHILLFVSDNGEEVAELERFGLIGGRQFIHEGQGTRNLCFAFENAYIELVWQHNIVEITDSRVAPTKLYERCNWPSLKANPFGFALQFENSEQKFYPFSTWEYKPAYLPSSIEAIRMSLSTSDAEEPLVFFVPEYAPDPNHKQQTLLGFKRITSCTLWLKNNKKYSDTVNCLGNSTFINVAYGRNLYLEIQFDGGKMGKRYDCKHRNLPVSFLW